MTKSLALYYATTPENADAILRHGFGGMVILKDTTVDGDQSKDQAIIEVSFDRDISQFVLPSAGMSYRRWRIPATFINSHAKSRPIHGRLLVSPKLKNYVERLSHLTPDQIVEIAAPAIIKKMMDCLQRMRPRQQKRADEAKKRVRRRPMDRDRAKQIVYAALAVTWKWLAEDQHYDVFRNRYDETRAQAVRASELIFRLSGALHVAASQNLALREKLEQRARTSDFDREMLEGWLSAIADLTDNEFEKLPEAFNSIEVIRVIEVGEDELPLWVKLPGGGTSRDVLLAWDTMHPIVRSNVERRLRNEPTRSILAALIRIPVLINTELRASRATNLPYVRLLQRRLNFLLGRSGLGIGAMEETCKESPSQEFVRLAQEAFGLGATARVSRHAVKDEHRRQRAGMKGSERRR